MDLLTVPVVPQVNAQRIQQIHGAAQTNPGIFLLVGDEVLVGIADIGGPNLNLDQFKADLEPVVQFYDAPIKGVNQPWNNGNFGSGDILNPAKGTAACQGKAPLACALEANPAVVLISVGRHDLAANVAIDKFKANLEAAVNEAIGKGVLPVLVTMTGPGPDPKVAEYNNAIYEVATAAQLPLLNIFGIKAQNAALIQNGVLTDPGAGQRAVFTAPALQQFGVNVANLRFLQTLKEIKAVIAP